VLVHVEDGKVVKIQGDPASPLNKGRMCVKGLSSIEHLYHPKRLKYPLKRAEKRGEGKWQRISWDEALGTIASKINQIREEYGVESVAVGTGTGRHHFQHVLRFANALGTPNWCEPGTAQCFIPRILTGLMTYGDLPVCDYYGEVNPACVLVWGHNPAVSGPDGEIQFAVKECLKKGTKLIVIDPRQTELAKKADLWLQVRPGTDDALALSMLNVIINEGLYDRPFVEAWTSGFEELRERVQEYPPDWAEEITWVPAGKIRAAARMFAQTSPATLEWGVALEHMDDPAVAIENWWRVLRPGGYLILYVPHRDLYEKKKELPSRWNIDHKHYFLIDKDEGPVTIGLVPLIERTLSNAVIVYAKECREGFKDPGLEVHSMGEYSIEIVVKKK